MLEPAARTRWPFKSARFLSPRSSLSVASSRPRRGSHLNFSSPSAARRRRSTGGGRPFARVGGATSGSASLDPCTGATLDKTKTKQNAHWSPEPARPVPHHPQPVVPCLYPTPAARGRGGVSSAPRRAPLGPARWKRIGRSAQGWRNAHRGGGKEPPSPPRC